MAIASQQPVTTGAASALGGGVARLGVPSIVFMIIAASAPLTVLAGGVTTNYAVSGITGVPLGMLLLAGGLLIYAVGYVAMSRHIRNAGAFYAYIARGLGPAAGVGGAWMALVAYNAMQIGIYGMLGFATSSFVAAKTGVEIPWWVFVLITIAVIAALGVNRVDLSVKVVGVLVALEFLVVLVYDLVALGSAPEGITASGFLPGDLFATGIGVVLVMGIAAFMGFESGAIYTEEAKEPGRTVPRATYAAVVIIGLFYAFSAWAMQMGSGPSQMVADAQASGPDLLFVQLGDRVGVLVADVAQLLFISSLLAAVISFHHAVARYAFALGREHMLPPAFGRANRRGAPALGSMAQTVVAVVVVIGFAIAGAGSELGPLYPVLTLFTWLTNLGALGLIVLMAVVSIAVIGFFARDARDTTPWSRMVAPAIAAAFFVTVTVLTLANWNLLLGQEETTALTFVLPALLVVAAVVGVAIALQAKAHRPAAFESIGTGVMPAVPAPRA
ncbi:APC family permease [Agrococcus sp. Marseille-P2731]|uniref:APC family permease n=1 Tax=Agrococcus sp. Marseille-P2731 TaxID=1841862 RepID=UPI0009F91B4C|nr:APC family permease [Agrococcus sp. Marseille-P2731]